MGVELRRFPEHHVTLAIFSGVVDPDQISTLLRSVDQRDRGCWIGYWHDDADISDVDVASFPVIKRLVAERQKAIFGDAPLREFVMVHPSGATEDLFRFLQKYWATGDESATPPRIFPDWRSASDWLGLSDEARKALTDATKRAGAKRSPERPNNGPRISGAHDQAPR